MVYFHLSIFFPIFSPLFSFYPLYLPSPVRICVTADFFPNCIGCFGVYSGDHVAFKLLELYMHLQLLPDLKGND
jgi:hypothetical protein